MSSLAAEPGSVLLTTTTLFSATALCVATYPELAIRVDAWLGGSGGPGGSLEYYRSFYVLPGALVFLSLAGIALAVAARRGRRPLKITALAAWLVLLGALVGSVEWYYAVVRRASELR